MQLCDVVRVVCCSPAQCAADESDACTNRTGATVSSIYASPQLNRRRPTLCLRCHRRCWTLTRDHGVAGRWMHSRDSKSQSSRIPPSSHPSPSTPLPLPVVVGIKMLQRLGVVSCWWRIAGAGSIVLRLCCVAPLKSENAIYMVNKQ